MSRMSAKLTSWPGLANNALASDKKPERIKILNWGDNPTRKGTVTVDERSLRVFPVVQQQSGLDVLALDFEHNTVPGSVEYERSQEPRAVAGHLKCEILRGDGVYCDMTDWTPEGDAMWKNYKDLSPAPVTVDIDGDGRNVLVGLHSVALTQHGAVDGLNFLSADGAKIACMEFLGPQYAPAKLQPMLMALSMALPAAFERGSDNNTKGYTLMKDQMKVLRSFLGMADGMGDEEVLKCMAAEIGNGKITRKGPLDNAGGATPAVKSFSQEDVEHMLKGQNPGTLGAQLKELMESTVKTMLEAKLNPLSANVTALTAAAKAATDATEAAQKQAIIDTATRARKVIALSADDIKALSVDLLRKVVDAIPVSSLQTRLTQPALVRKDEKGEIKGGAKLETLSVNDRHRRVSAAFETQLTKDGLPCKPSLLS